MLKKKFALLLCVSLTLSSMSTASAASDPGTTAASAITPIYEYSEEVLSPQFWDLAEDVNSSSETLSVNQTDNHMTVVPLDETWTIDDWDNYEQGVMARGFDSQFQGTSSLARGSSVPSLFFDSNKNIYSQSLENIAYLQTFYTDHYFPSGPDNKIYMRGSLWLDSDVRSGTIQLQLYEYSPNYGVYGCSVDWDYLMSAVDAYDPDSLIARYTVVSGITNLQPNNLYYFKFVNRSGATVDSGWFEISGEYLAYD